MKLVTSSRIMRILNRSETLCRILCFLQLIILILLLNYIFITTTIKNQVVFVKQETSVNVIKQDGDSQILINSRQEVQGDVQVEEVQANFAEPAEWEFRRNWPEETKKKLSTLGRRMFLGDYKNQVQQDREFTIAVWQFGSYLERRFLKWFSTESHEPFEVCSVQNCRLVYDDGDESKLPEANAVLIHLHRTAGPHTLPKYRRDDQRWIFMTDENPFNTFLLTRTYTMKDFNHLFNWSMTYRYDADIPVPYGRTIPLPDDERITQDLPGNFALNKKKLVAIYASDCIGKNDRWNYIQDLKQYIPIDIYGKCGPQNCTLGKKLFGADCPLLRQYKFYLAFENANCEGYITEKFWFNAFDKNMIPIVMGATKEEYKLFAPENSYIHVDDFGSPSELADYILKVNSSDELFNSYFQWKKKYKLLNEHGYFGVPNFHYCRICEALNYNSQERKIYDNLESYWDYQNNCKQ